MSSDVAEKGYLKQFIKGGSSGLLVKGFGLGTKALMQFLLAAWLSAKGYGIYSYVVTLTFSLSVFGQLGLQTVVLRFIPTFKSEKNWNKLYGILYIAFRIGFISGVFLLIGSEYIVWLLRARLGHTLLISLQVGLLLVPLLVLSGLRQSALQSFKSIFKSRFPEMVLIPITIIIGAGILYVFNIATAINLIYIRIVVVFVGFLLGMIWLFREMPFSLRNVTPEYNSKEVIYVALPLLLASSMELILNKTDILMLGFLKPMEDVGIYNLSLQMASLTSFGLTSVTLVAAPMISEYYKKNDIENLKNTVSITTWTSTVFSIGAILVIFFIGNSILTMIGNEFSTGETALWILISGQFLNSITGPVALLLAMTGHQKQFSKVIIISSILNIILNYLFIPVLGIEGAAVATMISTILWNIWMSYDVWKFLNLKPSILTRPSLSSLKL